MKEIKEWVSPQRYKPKQGQGVMVIKLIYHKIHSLHTEEKFKMFLGTYKKGHFYDSKEKELSLVILWYPDYPVPRLPSKYEIDITPHELLKENNNS